MKTGFWLRGGNGKLAGATVYQDGQGNTVMREVVSPSNPKTRAQMIQRNQRVCSLDHIQESSAFTVIYYLLHLHFI